MIDSLQWFEKNLGAFEFIWTLRYGLVFIAVGATVGAAVDVVVGASCSKTTFLLAGLDGTVSGLLFLVPVHFSGVTAVVVLVILFLR
jgi:membrane associated rhomboid family serine protease